MGGFLGGLTDLLGGWNAARRIDTEGFNWREKQAQQDFLRQRQRTEAQQQDEDRAVNIGRDVMLGADEGEEPDLSKLLPGYDQGLTKARVRGAVAQSRPALQAQQAYARQALEETRGGQRLAEIGARGDKAQELAEIMMKLRSTTPMTEFQRRSLEQRAQAIQQRGQSRGVQGTLVPLKDDTGGIKGFYNNKTGEFTPAGEGVSGLRTTPLGVTAQEQLALGTQGAGSIETIKNLLRQKPAGEEWTGPMAATEYQLRSGQGPRPISIAAEALGVEPPGGKQAIFYSAVGNLKNSAIKYVTGAQMSEKEVPRLMQEIPTQEDRGDVFLAKLAVTEARLNLLDQVRRGQITREQAIQQINTMGPEQYLEQYQKEGLTTGASAPKPGGRRYVVRPE